MIREHLWELLHDPNDDRGGQTWWGKSLGTPFPVDFEQYVKCEELLVEVVY